MAPSAGLEPALPNSKSGVLPVRRQGNGAGGGSRTHTEQGLSLPPLPIGLHQHLKLLSSPSQLNRTHGKLRDPFGFLALPSSGVVGSTCLATWRAVLGYAL